MKNCFLFASAMLFLIILPCVMADAEQYLTPGVNRDNPYYQEGTGVWTGRTPTTYTRVGSYVPYSSPLVADLDNDGTNEIVMVTYNDSIQVLNFTNGVGLVLKDDITYGLTYFGSGAAVGSVFYHATPGLLDYDSDGFTEIIYFNRTHALAFNYSSGTLALEQSVETIAINTTNTASGTNYEVVKCTPASTISKNKDTCVYLIQNLSGAFYYYTLVSYNLDDNTVTYSSSTVGMCYSSSCGMQPYHNTHLFDGDEDGFVEAYFSIDNAGNGDLEVDKVEVGVNSTIIQAYYDNNAVGTTYSDIVVSKLDGANPLITWWYEASDNYYAKTYKISTNALISTAYCGILTCPEGNYASENLVVATDTTYCDYSGDVYFYVRNYEESDPGANIDTIMCLSQYAGEGYHETTVSNSKNDTHSTFAMHQANLFGTTSLLLSQWAVQGGTKQSLPSFSNDEFIIPVDYQKSGSLDMIGLNSSRLIYYDDAYTNQNTIIDSIAPDTGNSICTGETLTTTLSISDFEDDFGNCYIRVNYANGTSYSNVSNTSFTGGQAAVDLYFTAAVSTQTTFIHYYSCKDQYHITYFERAYSVSYSNQTCGSGACNCKGYGTPVPTTYAANATVEADVFDDTWDAFGITSTKSKSILGIAVIIGIMVSVGAIAPAPILIAGAGLLATILVTFMGLISAYILILIIISLALIVLVGGFVTNKMGGG